VEFDIEERILQNKTLKLLLQPLVENAIFHGIEPRDGAGIIRVKGWMEDKDICFSVTDNGIGINTADGDEKDNGTALTERVLSSAGGMGLRNVQHRIQLHFGDQYRIEIHRPKNGGTAVVLRWPVFRRVEELKR
jgi:two-component system sensor histidine kinase YesM